MKKWWFMLAVAAGCTADVQTKLVQQDDWVVTQRWDHGTIRRQVKVENGDSVEVRMFHEEGGLDRVGRYKDGEKHGVWQAFYPDGTLWSEHLYEAGTQTGTYRTFHPNGKPSIVGEYNAAGEPVGIWRFYGADGALVREIPGAEIQN